jgi:hypothetical protein
MRQTFLHDGDWRMERLRECGSIGSDGGSVIGYELQGNKGYGKPSVRTAPTIYRAMATQVERK